MIELGVINNCGGCGACCMEQESPPGYVLLMVHGYGEVADRVRLERMPRELYAGLEQHVENVRAGQKRPDQVCIWFDRETRQCRHYEWRPEICRDFEVGTNECRRWRADYAPLATT